MRSRSLLGVLALTAALFAACEDSTPPAPNQPPDTYITGSEPRDSSRIQHRLDIQWRGADPDGTPAYFQYILDTYPRAIERIDDIVLRVPAVDDPRWGMGRVDANHLVVVALADTLRVDPRTAPPPHEFDRWHTFYVRAVDNEGTIDETPDFRTFQAYTPAPVLYLTEPLAYAQTVTLPRTLVAHWDGYDPIGGGQDNQNPKESRWVHLRCTLDGGGDPLGFPDSLYALAESRWSAWAPWSTTDGRSAVLRDLVAAGAGQQAYVFAVQGRDDGGAVTPTFASTTEFQNNYAVLVADGSLPVGPSISILVHHALTDTLHVVGDGAPPEFLLSTSADTVVVGWTPPNAERYGANASQTRYGWDIQDPGDDFEWTSWGTTRISPPHAVAGGTVFWLQARDDIGRGDPKLNQVTTVRVILQAGP